MRFFVGILLALSLTACGGGRNPDLEAAARILPDQKVGSMKVDILSGHDTLQFQADGALLGTGVVRMAIPLAKAESANHYTLQLDLGSEGKVTLVANGKADLSSGVEIEIAKTPAGLKVTARVANDSLDLSQFFADVDPSKPFEFDVHNDHGAASHIIAWQGQRELLEDSVQGRGMGEYWGLRLEKAKIINATTSTPRDEH